MGLAQRWRSLWSAASADVDDARWVVVDVESSGLDARRDRLLAIAATALHFDAERRRPRIVLGDSFELLLRQAADAPVDKANILLHGIGIGAQREGVPAAEALRAWQRYVGRSPLLAYHADFDRTLIGRACREQLGAELSNRWLDLEPLAAVIHDDPLCRSLDHWLARHGIACLARHHAASDVLATAQLLLALWPAVRARGDGRFASVADLARAERFIAGRR